jgi:hypothetical protein
VGTEPSEVGAWHRQVRDWQVNYFTISDADANSPRLLRKVADAMEDLANIQILDITWCKELGGHREESEMTVYFRFPDSS